MTDKLCISERRARMLDFLILRKRTSISELAGKFNVSINTISRDISFLSTIAPVYTKQGNKGGVYILPEYRSYKNYLSDREERCLYEVMKVADTKNCRIICEIITKFTRGIDK